MTERRDADNIILEIAGTTNRLRYNQNRLNQIISGKIAGERGERDYLEEMIAMHHQELERLELNYERQTGRKLIK